jgi:hypothetical protein
MPVHGESFPGRGHLSVNSGKVVIDYDPHKWRLTDGDEKGFYMLRHISGIGMALVIADGVSTPVDALPDLALAEARTEAANARIVFQQRRLVEGIPIWCIKIEADIKDVQVVYYGYYYGGKAGTVRVITFVEKEYLGDDLQRDFARFLNGLRIDE